MPKLFSRISTWEASGSDKGTTTELKLEGFIDAANYLTFEKSLESACRAGHRFLIVDFTAVHYINSTGISALIRYFESYRLREGALCLANVAKSVGLSMHLLGVTSFLPFFKDRAAARAYIKDLLGGKATAVAPRSDADAPRWEVSDDASLEGHPKRAGSLRARFIPLRRRRLRGLKKARVLVITPSKSRFTRVLRLRFNSLNGDYHLLHDIQEALQRYEEMSPDLVVVDERSDPKGDFVNRVKIQKGRSLTSVIKTYSTHRDVQGELEFKIWENDYLVEPFEVLELFSLTEAELCRVPKDKKVFVQQVHFEFKTRTENIERAYKLSDLILRQSIAIQEEATALYAAVKEAIDNAAVHGNRKDSSKTIDVNFLVDKKKITVIVEDQGAGFDCEYYLSRIHDDEAFEKAKRRILQEGARGGLGILLMSKCSDRIEYSGAGNVLRLEKNL